MRYYIATSTSRIPSHNLVKEDLHQLGHEITYDWTSHGSVRETNLHRLREVAHAEFQGIHDADFVVVLLPGGKGTHTELGFSIATKKKVFIHSENPLDFEVGPQVCAFYHHAEVVRLLCRVEEVAQAVHSHLMKTAQEISCHSA